MLARISLSLSFFSLVFLGWSFGTTGAIEGLDFIVTGTLQSLSEEQLVDCCHNNCNGCNGGNQGAAMDYITARGSDSTEASYPYTAGSGKPGTCQAANGTPFRTSIGSNKYLYLTSDANLAAAVKQVPVTVTVNAKPFMSYAGGVFKSTCSGAWNDLDHAVLAVGYTSNFWLIKNSWGPSWGASGYIRFGRGPSFGSTGQCGILSAAYQPIASAEFTTLKDYDDFPDIVDEAACKKDLNVKLFPSADRRAVRVHVVGGTTAGTARVQLSLLGVSFVDAVVPLDTEGAGTVAVAGGLPSSTYTATVTAGGKCIDDVKVFVA